MYMCVYLVPRGQRCWSPLELKLQIVVKCLVVGAGIQTQVL